MSEESTVKSGDKISFTFAGDKHLEGTIMERPSQHNYGCYVVKTRPYDNPDAPAWMREPKVVHVRDWITMTLGWLRNEEGEVDGSA